MVIFLNGPFGVGKTTVARLLVRKLARATTYDPERAGYVLQRLPRWVPFAGQGSGDFQDMPSWRRLTVVGIRATRLLHSVVVVPMTFANVAYFEEIAAAVREFEADVLHFRLTAPWPVVEKRLLSSGCIPEAQKDAWRFRRARECCDQIFVPGFGWPIDTVDARPEDVTEDIFSRLP